MTPVTPRIQWTPEGKPRITNGVQVLLYVSSLPFHEQALFFKRAINHLGGGLTSDDTFMLWLLRIARPQLPETPAQPTQAQGQAVKLQPRHGGWALFIGTRISTVIVHTDGSFSKNNATREALTGYRRWLKN